MIGSITVLSLHCHDTLSSRCWVAVTPCPSLGSFGLLYGLSAWPGVALTTAPVTPASPWHPSTRHMSPFAIIKGWAAGCWKEIKVGLCLSVCSQLCNKSEKMLSSLWEKHVFLLDHVDNQSFFYMLVGHSRNSLFRSSLKYMKNLLNQGRCDIL